MSAIHPAQVNGRHKKPLIGRPAVRSAALAAFVPRWRVADRGYGGCGIWFCRPERCLGRLMAGLRHWQRLSPGGASLTGATGKCGVWVLPPGAMPWGADGRSAALAPFVPRWRVADRGYGQVRYLVLPPGAMPWGADGRSAALAPLVPRWRVADRGYGQVRCLGLPPGAMPLSICSPGKA